MARGCRDEESRVYDCLCRDRNASLPVLSLRFSISNFDPLGNAMEFLLTLLFVVDPLPDEKPLLLDIRRQSAAENTSCDHVICLDKPSFENLVGLGKWHHVIRFTCGNMSQNER